MAERQEIVRNRRRQLRQMGVDPKTADRVRYWSDERFGAFVNEYRDEAYKETRREIQNAKRRSQYQHAREMGLTPKQAKSLSCLKDETFNTRIGLEQVNIEWTKETFAMTQEQFKEYNKDDSYPIEVIALAQRANYDVAKEFDLSFTFDSAKRSGEIDLQSSAGWGVVYKMLVEDMEYIDALEALNREIDDYTNGG